MNFAAILAAGIASGGFFALLAMSLQLTYSSTGILNFAQGDLAVGGAFCYWELTTQAHLDGWVSLAICLPLGMIVGACVFSALRAFTRRSTLEASLATIAVSFCLEGMFQYVFGSQTDLAPALIPGPPLHILGAVVPRQNIVVVAAAIVLGAAVALVLQRTRLGLMVRIVASNPEGARSVGVSVDQTQCAVFAIGGVLSFAAGALMASIIGASFVAGQNLIITSFVAAVLGGLGGLWSAALGGLVLGVLQTYLGTTSAGTYTETTLFVVLMAVLLLRPKGLVARRAAA